MPGWAWLGVVVSDGSMRLIIAQTNNEDNTLMHGVSDCPCVPILGLDLWEHAYWE